MNLNKKAVFLDRDGVVNKALIRNGQPYPPPSIEELEILPGVQRQLNYSSKPISWLL